MLDVRLYRAAFLPLLLVLLVLAFSLGDRPRPIGTTFSPDTFYGDRALATLDALAARFPERRPGSDADRRMATFVAAELRRAVPGTVDVDTFQARTIDGKRELTNVAATRLGRPGPSIVLVAHRDAVGQGARAELSGTATLLELARVVGTGRLQRTITFISTSGGSGGFEGATHAVQQIDGPVDAVIVLGAVGAQASYRPMVVGTSNGLGQAPLQLQRTVQQAVERQAGIAPGAPRAFIQGLRMAAPMTTGEQGPFVRAGLPAVLVSATGERVPPADAHVSLRRLERLGRAVLGALYALDNGPDISHQGPTQELVLRGKVVPSWAMRLLILALLLPPLVTSIDAMARLRRRREPVAPWLLWALSPAVPIVICCLTAVLLSVSGLVSASPSAPMPPGAIEFSGAVLAAVLVLLIVAVLAWIGLRPPLLRSVGLSAEIRPDRLGAGVAAGMLVPIVALLLWVPNPYAAGAMVPAAHLWLWATAPETGLRRLPAAALAVAGLALPLVVVCVLARIFGLSIFETPWFWVLLVAGGHMPWWTWLLWSGFFAAAITTAIVIGRRSEPVAVQPVTVRGPQTYAGPGSLGGTGSAIRR